MKLLLKCTDMGLIPLYNSDLDTKKKLKIGETYEATIVKPRNVAFHRKFFALINMVYENQEIYSNIDDLREELTKSAGFYRTYLNHKGNKCYKAQSISFAKMSQDEFDTLYSRFLDVVEYTFKFERELIKENIEQFY